MPVPINIVQSGQSRESLMRAIIIRTIMKATRIPLMFILYKHLPVMIDSYSNISYPLAKRLEVRYDNRERLSRGNSRNGD